MPDHKGKTDFAGCDFRAGLQQLQGDLLYRVPDDSGDRYCNGAIG